MKLAKNLNNLGTETAFSVLAEAKALEAKGNPMIHLGLGQPDFKTPKHVVEAAKKALDDGHHGYVLSNGILECRQAVTRWIKKRYNTDVDADRILISDELGKLVDGDQLMALVAQNWFSTGRLQGGGVVATVMSNLGLENYLSEIGLKLVRTQVGDRYVVEHMRQYGFNIGGEQSGHIVLSDYGSTGDGLVAALQILAVVVQSDSPVSKSCRPFVPLPQLLRNVAITDGRLLNDEDVRKSIAVGEEKLSGTGRLLIRESGTESLIRVMAEGRDEKLINKVVSDIVSAVERAEN